MSEEKFIKMLFGDINSYSVEVNEETALQCSAVLACTRVLSESVAQLPLKLYRRKGELRNEATDHYLYSLLHDAPNERMTAFAFWEYAQATLPLWGNFYALIDRDGGGKVSALWPLDPSKVEPRKTKKGNIMYQVSSSKGQTETYLWDEIFHIPGLGFDGLKGQSLVRLASEAIGQGMAASEYAGKFFENDATPRGVLEMDGFLRDETAITRLRKSWDELYRGQNNSHRVAILENGLKFKPLTVNPEDAQLLDTRKFNRSEIAGIFRVPPHLIGDLEHATFTNIEHQSIEFVKYTLAPWLKRIEQTIALQLLTPTERKKHFAEFVVDGLMRGDIKSRYEAYQTAITGGWMSINEVRKRENMNPIEGGDEHYLQMQMVPISKVGEENGGEAGAEGNQGD